jgi:hypothetical protein
MAFGPSLRCVLQHWYELRLPGEPTSAENTKRAVAVRSMNMVLRRQGLDALKGQCRRAARAEIVAEPIHLLVGAGVSSGDVVFETWVRRSLGHPRVDFRVAATYASVFFMEGSQEVARVLTERVILAEGVELVLAATRDALDIWSYVRTEGTCPRCGQTAGPPSTQKPLVLQIARA